MWGRLQARAERREVESCGSHVITFLGCWKRICDDAWFSLVLASKLSQDNRRVQQVSLGATSSASPMITSQRLSAGATHWLASCDKATCSPCFPWGPVGRGVMVTEAPIQ